VIELAGFRTVSELSLLLSECGDNGCHGRGVWPSKEAVCIVSTLELQIVLECELVREGLFW